MVGGSKRNRLLGPLGHVIRLRLASLFGGRKFVFFIARVTKADLEALRGLIEAGKVRPAVDRRYRLSEAAAAFDYLGEGHAHAKVVVSVP